MYKKLTKSEIVDAIWDIRDIPEYLEEMSVAELKQTDFLLQDWQYEIHKYIADKFIESGYKVAVWTSLEKENLFNGFSMNDVMAIRDKIKIIIDPKGHEDFDRILKKLANDFDYKFVTPKYTIIYHFLNTVVKIMPFSKTDYIKHIQSNFDLGNKMFTRFAFDDYTDKRHADNVKKLMKIIER